MPITNPESGTRIDEIADGIYRISTPVPPSPALPPGFTFNQILIVDDDSLLFHTGPRRMFPLVHQALASVLPPERLRWVAFSHVEGDECGSLAEWLAVAPSAAPVCSRVAAMVYTEDATDRPARALADGDKLSLGRHSVQWFDAPHVPHGWDCGFLGETTTRTLLCGDLFTQGGAELPPVTESEILGPRLLRSFAGNRADTGAACGVRATPPRLHARQLVPRRRSSASPRPCKIPRS